MSYDLYLLSPVPGEEPLKTAHAKCAVESDVINPGPPRGDAETRKRHLMQELVAENPALEPFQFGYAEIARTHGFSEEEARVRYRHIELNGPDDGNGIQITLYDDGADITVPYWHAPPAARLVFEEVWRYLRRLHDASGFFVYDPQLDRVIDVETDLSDVVARYNSVVAKLSQILDQAQSSQRSP